MYRFTHREEPVPPDTPEALAKVAGAQLPIRLATGERLFSKWDYRPVLAQNLVDVAQRSVHLAASIPNFLILEMAHQPLRDAVQTQGLVIRDGWAELPRQPGLGIALNDEVIATHPYAPGDYEPAFYADGSVAEGCRMHNSPLGAHNRAIDVRGN